MGFTWDYPYLTIHSSILCGFHQVEDLTHPSILTIRWWKILLALPYLFGIIILLALHSYENGLISHLHLLHWLFISTTWAHCDLGLFIQTQPGLWRVYCFLYQTSPMTTGEDRLNSWAAWARHVSSGLGTDQTCHIWASVFKVLHVCYFYVVKNIMLTISINQKWKIDRWKTR